MKEKLKTIFIQLFFVWVLPDTLHIKDFAIKEREGYL